MRLSIKAGITLIVLATLIACTKTNEPFQITVKPGLDSLTLQPIQFSAITSEAADSYLWDFGDGGTSDIPFTQHIYKQMGIYNVSCTATIRGKKYIAGIRFEVKGDSRMVGQRRFYGTHYYNQTLGPLGSPLDFVTRNISDTLLTFTFPSQFNIAVNGKLFGMWQHDNGTDILYQLLSTTTYGKFRTYIFYYPANDSMFVYNSFGDNPRFGDRQEYKLSQKK